MSGKERKTIDVHLEIGSYKKNFLKYGCKDLGVVDNGHHSNSSFKLDNGVLEGLDDSYCEFEAAKGVDRMNICEEESKEMVLSASLVGEECGGGLRDGDVEQLCLRLQMLEEENRSMKEAFFESVKERSELMSEVFEKLCFIHKHVKGRVTGKESLNAPTIFDSNKEESMLTGLSQVLYQETNPALVTRVHKANVFAFQEAI